MTKRWDANPNGKFLENFTFDRIQLKYVKTPKKTRPFLGIIDDHNRRIEIYMAKPEVV
jgi:hypothetical protein